MTVCVAALASYTKESSAIVCLADKLVSYGEIISGETDQSKIIELNPSGMVCMTSGNEEELSRFVASLLATENFGSDVRSISKKCEDEYKTSLEELIDRKFLFPRLLTREQYVTATSGAQINKYMHSLADQIGSYSMVCDVLLCGYEARGDPFILSAYHPGIVTDMTRTGFHAVGAGYDHAIGKLIAEEHERKDSLPNVMYDILDAKITAEIGPFVGYDWDTVIITRTNGDTKRHLVPDEVNDLLDKLWLTANRSPFQEPHDDPPPRNWRKKLNDYAESILPGSSIAVDKRKTTA